MKKHLILLIIACAALSAHAPRAWAQTSGAAVAGVVRNRNGEPVAGAKVTAANVATSQARAATTDGEGSYRLPSLVVGTYEIVVEEDGYSRAIRQQTLRVNEEARVDFELAMPGVEENVSVVSSSAPLTETGTSVLGVVIENKQITELPLNGRNTLVGPSYKNTDLSLTKDTRFGEGLTVQARFEVFNVFNTTNLALPTRNLSDPFFGRSTRTQDVAGGVPGIGGSGPRVMHVGFKVRF